MQRPEEGNRERKKPPITDFHGKETEIMHVKSQLVKEKKIK
jgi:hypothetical protein